MDSKMTAKDAPSNIPNASIMNAGEAQVERIA